MILILLFYTSKCKKFEDQSIPVIAFCGLTEDKLLGSAKILRQKLFFVNKMMNKTDEILNDTKDHQDACVDMIADNNIMIEEILKMPTNKTKTNLNKLTRSLSCSPDQKLELKFQMKMMKSTSTVFSKSLYKIQEKLKSKYFFGSVLELIKFLSDNIK